MDQILKVCHDYKLPHTIDETGIHVQGYLHYGEVIDGGQTFDDKYRGKLRRLRHLKYKHQLQHLNIYQVDFEQPLSVILGSVYKIEMETEELPALKSMEKALLAKAFINNYLPKYQMELAGSIINETSVEGYSDVDIKIFTEDVVKTYRDIHSRLESHFPIRRQRHSLRIITESYGQIDLVPFNKERGTICSLSPKHPLVNKGLLKEGNYEILPSGHVMTKGGHILSLQIKHKAVVFIGLSKEYLSMNPDDILRLMLYCSLHNIYLNNNDVTAEMRAEMNEYSLHQRKDSDVGSISEVVKMLLPTRKTHLAPTLGNLAKSAVIDFFVLLRDEKEDLLTVRKEVEKDIAAYNLRIFPCCMQIQYQGFIMRFFIYNPWKNLISKLTLDL